MSPDLREANLEIPSSLTISRTLKPTHAAHLVVFDGCCHIQRVVFEKCPSFETSPGCVCANLPEDEWLPATCSMTKAAIAIEVEELRQIPSHFPSKCDECQTRTNLYKAFHHNKTVKLDSGQRTRKEVRVEQRSLARKQLNSAQFSNSRIL